MPDTLPPELSIEDVQVQYDYDAGVLNKISDYNNSATVFWQRNAGDARGNAIDESLGNGVKVMSSFDEVTC